MSRTWAKKKRLYCDPKQQYLSENSALMACGALRCKYETMALHAYQCGYCGFWHVGNDRKFKPLIAEFTKTKNKSR